MIITIYNNNDNKNDNDDDDDDDGNRQSKIGSGSLFLTHVLVSYDSIPMQHWKARRTLSN